MKTQLFSKRRGFTMIELLVASTIIIILSVIAMVNFSSSLKRARDAKRVADLKQIQAALEMYRSANGSYPTAASDGGVGSFNTLITTLNTGGYFNQPTLTDPKNAPPYYYYRYFSTAAAPAVYDLCAVLENPGSDCRNSLTISGVVYTGYSETIALPEKICCYKNP